jgi:integrase/recombinase XerD
MEPVPGVRGQVEDFLAWCQGRGLSPKTWRDAYGYPLRAVLLPFCERQDIADLTDLDRRAIDRLAAELYQREPPLSPASVKSYLKSVNQLMAWWEQESGERQARAQLPRLKKKRREVLSRAELDDLEAAAPNERDKLIIRIMGDVGAREGEVANLRVGDLVARERTYFLRLRGKTGERMAPISPALYRRLKHYGEKGRPRVATSDKLFLSLRRHGDDYPYLTPGGVYQVVRDAALLARFERPVFPHLLRHSAITHLVSQGMQPVAVCEIVGCSLAVVMEVYSHLTDEQRWHAFMRVIEAQ